MAKGQGIAMRWVIYCHPDHVEDVRRFLATMKSDIGLPFLDEEIIGHEFMPKTARCWEFPKTPFVQYERKDEAWAVPLGFGRWVDDDRPVFYRMRVDAGVGNWGHHAR